MRSPRRSHGHSKSGTRSPTGWTEPRLRQRDELLLVLANAREHMATYINEFAGDDERSDIGENWAILEEWATALIEHGEGWPAYYAAHEDEETSAES